MRTASLPTRSDGQLGQLGQRGQLAGFDPVGLRERLRAWAHECGFSQIGVAGIELASAEAGLKAWLSNGFHGSMDYMARHGLKRARPAELVPGTASVITARMDYLPRDAPAEWVARERARVEKAAAGEAVISVYARGRDYHKVLRQRLQQLADRLADEVGPFGHRVFTDSAPVLEVELATRTGLGWRGKHTLALARDGGSTFFLGEIFVDLALSLDAPASEHCGACTACLDACPTGAIVAPYRLDARRCISYLTIELHGAIPLEWRAAIGNRIYGCDDCQLVCPWNKYARRSALPDFDERHGLGSATLLALWAWDEGEFLRRTEGSAIRRVGYARWRRNLAVALGNALRAGGDAAAAAAVAAALAAAREGADDLVREHIDWALAQAA
ncbi:MAG: tRNA epoxyqueuosine(34) reductase QueG [Burkholderiales bacterium]|nr:tRNA epoxyqueuosine(34) reductase QueG [Burkholderiales bacterium]